MILDLEDLRKFENKCLGEKQCFDPVQFYNESIKDFLEEDENNFIIIDDNGDYTCHSLSYIYNKLKVEEDEFVEYQGKLLKVAPIYSERKFTNPQNISEQEYLNFNAGCQKNWGSPGEQEELIFKLIDDELYKYYGMTPDQIKNEIQTTAGFKKFTESILNNLIRPKDIIYYNVGTTRNQYIDKRNLQELFERVKKNIRFFKFVDIGTTSELGFIDRWTIKNITSSLKIFLEDYIRLIEKEKKWLPFYYVESKLIDERNENIDRFGVQPVSGNHCNYTNKPEVIYELVPVHPPDLN